MKHTDKVLHATLGALFMALTGCIGIDEALDPNDTRPSVDELSAQHGAASEEPSGTVAELAGCPRPCILTGKEPPPPPPPGMVEIEQKRASLDPGVRSAYFARETSDVTLTADGRAYTRSYEGDHGRGVIFDTFEGTYAMYGAILRTWEADSFWVGFIGYPTSDEYDGSGGRLQRFTTERLPAPDYINGCLLEIEHYLSWRADTGNVSLLSTNLYQVDHYPGPPSLSRAPQTVTPNQYVQWVWCGTVPEWWDDPWTLGYTNGGRRDPGDI